MKYPVLFIDTTAKEVGFFSKPINICLVDSVNTFNGNILIDTTGKKFKIIEAKVTGWAFFWGYHPLYKGRSVKIDLAITENGNLSLEDLKMFLIVCLKNDWNFLKAHPESIEEWESRINDSKTYEDVIHLFMHDFD